MKITLDAGSCDLSDAEMVKIIDALRRGDFIKDEGFTEEEARELLAHREKSK